MSKEIERIRERIEGLANHKHIYSCGEPNIDDFLCILKMGMEDYERFQAEVRGILREYRSERRISEELFQTFFEATQKIKDADYSEISDYLRRRYLENLYRKLEASLLDLERLEREKGTGDTQSYANGGIEDDILATMPTPEELKQA